MADAGRILRFLAVGGVSTAIHLVVQHALVDHARAPAYAGWLGGFLAAVSWSWLAHHHLTFRSSRPPTRTAAGWLVRSLALQAAAFAIFGAMLRLVGDDLHLLATLVAAAIVQVVGYALARRHFLAGEAAQ